MSNAVLVSIQPEWCELIANGKKKVEVRKTRPKLKAPFKCYIYCTIGKEKLWILNPSERPLYPNNIAKRFNAKSVGGATNVNGKVIGEFICNSVINIPYSKYFVDYYHAMPLDVLEATCLGMRHIDEYLLSKSGYAWLISDLVIYDKPKELSEFARHDTAYDNAFGWAFEDRPKRVALTRPPQSWCYVDEIPA